MARQFFRTIAYVDPQAMDHGTKVRVTLQSETVASVLATAWIAMVGAFNVAVLALVLGGATQFWNLVVPLVMLIFGFAFIALGRWLVRAERAALLDYVRVVISPR
jgi:hypothetical protein